MSSRSEVLQLYKKCLIYINSLKYTDKDYLRNRIRQEFKKEGDLDQQYKRGLAFLERSRFV